MKKYSRLTLVVAFLVAMATKGFAGDVYVRGYTKSNGTYVRGHYRSRPDGNFGNNWSTKGNVNPYTGKAGTRVTPPGSSSRTTLRSAAIPLRSSAPIWSGEFDRLERERAKRRTDTGSGSPSSASSPHLAASTSTPERPEPVEHPNWKQQRAVALRLARDQTASDFGEKGFIFFLTNSATPGYVKVARTSGNVKDELARLNQKVRFPFEVHSIVEVYQSTMIEVAIRRFLGNWDEVNGFYRVDPQIAFKQTVKMARENNAYMVMHAEPQPSAQQQHLTARP